MLNISGLSEGTVLDHIKTDKSLDIYYQLGPNKLDSRAAIIRNVYSQKTGRKDIVKAKEDVLDRIDLDILGYIDRSVTVNTIRNSKTVKKRVLRLLKQTTNVIHCKNPRCITSIEQELPHIFYLSDPERETYRCRYCDERYTDKTRRVPVPFCKILVRLCLVLYNINQQQLSHIVSGGMT